MPITPPPGSPVDKAHKMLAQQGITNPTTKQVNELAYKIRTGAPTTPAAPPTPFQPNLKREQANIQKMGYAPDPFNPEEVAKFAKMTYTPSEISKMDDRTKIKYGLIPDPSAPLQYDPKVLGQQGFSPQQIGALGQEGKALNLAEQRLAKTSAPTASAMSGLQTALRMVNDPGAYTGVQSQAAKLAGLTGYEPSVYIQNLRQKAAEEKQHYSDFSTILSNAASEMADNYNTTLKQYTLLQDQYNRDLDRITKVNETLQAHKFAMDEQANTARQTAKNKALEGAISSGDFSNLSQTYKAIESGDFSSVAQPVSIISTGNARMDQNDNFIAAAISLQNIDPKTGKPSNEYTKALDQAGIDWSVGTTFKDDPSMATIQINGDPIEGARAILANSSSIQNWYLNHTGRDILRKFGIKNNEDFQKAPTEIQNMVIAGINKGEGGNGDLSIASAASVSPYPPNPKTADVPDKTTGVTPNGIYQAAIEYAITGKMPSLGYGGMGAVKKTRAKIISIAGAMMAAAGTNSPVLQAEYAANKTAFTKMFTLQAQVNQFEDTALKNWDVAIDEAKKVFNTDSPKLNEWQQYFLKQWVGDPGVVGYQSAINTFAREYAKVMSGATSASGATVTSQADATDMINSYLNKSQIKELGVVLHKDFQNRKDAIQGQVDQLGTNLGSFLQTVTNYNPSQVARAGRGPSQEDISAAKTATPSGQITIFRPGYGLGWVPPDELQLNDIQY